MAGKLRVAAVGSLAAGAVLIAVFAGAYVAARQVRPFYEQALRVEPEVLERGRLELESRATALYSDVRQVGQWHALFTAEQINGWLATQLTEKQGSELPTNLRDPRVAIAPNVLTLGFRTTSRGVDTAISVDAAVFLTDEGAVAVQFVSVKAGALPIPVLPLADQIAVACKELKLPVRWTQKNSLPVAIIEIESDPSTEKRQFYIDSIELGEGELYVAGHTEDGAGSASPTVGSRVLADPEVKMADFELQLTPSDTRSALKIGRRAGPVEAENE